MGIQDQKPSMESKRCQDQNSSTIKNYQSLTVFYTNADNLIKKERTLSFNHVSKTGNHCIREIRPKNASLPANDCELQIQGFDCFTDNIQSLCHRPVLIYTKKCLKAVAVNFS